MAQSTIQTAVESDPTVRKARTQLDLFRQLHPGIDYDARTLQRLLTGRKTRSRLNYFRSLHPDIDADARTLEHLQNALALAENIARVAAHTGHNDHTNPACPGCKVLAAFGYRPMQTAPVVEPPASGAK